MPNDSINDFFIEEGSTIFEDGLNAYAVPWQELDIADSLDLLYLSHSGEKKIAPIVLGMLDSDGALSSLNFEYIIKALYNLYNKKWQRLWDVYQAEYTALNNYDLTEAETIESATTDAGSSSESETIESSAESSATSEGEDNTGLYGFASSKQVSSDTKATTADTSSSTSGKSITTRSGERSNNGTGSTTRSLTRSGNMGIRSNQELLQQEIDLWQWNFFEQVFNDIDSILTLRVY